jgi:hypothetical protein
MSPLVYLALYGWIPVVLYLFSRFPPRRAVVISFIAAWLFLPAVTFPLPGLPDLSKMSVTCYGILLATVVFDIGRFKSFKFSWLDWPMLVWCTSPFMSAISNDLGWYDGLSAVLDTTVTWGLPYFLGRIYLNDLSALRELAIAIVIGGLIYIPFCLYEARMSVNLHGVVYGIIPYQASYIVSLRYGGYRPAVFMASGLMLGAWMTAAALSGLWLWHTKVIKSVMRLSMQWVVAALFITVVLVKATGAWFLLAFGAATLFVGKWVRSTFLLWVLVIGIPLYVILSVNGIYVGESVANTLSKFLPPERIQSYVYRVDQEKALAERARQRIVWGWGGFGRNMITNEWGEAISITDSLWIIAFGSQGAVGLFSITAALLLPSIAFERRYPVRLWATPQVAPAAVLAVLVVLYMLDCILNAMTNPVYVLTCGGIAGVSLKPVTLPKRKLTAAPYSLRHRPNR